MTFESGETKTSITIPLADDEVSEPNESFFIDIELLMSCPGVGIGEASLEVVVKDNDALECGWDPEEYMVNEESGQVIGIVVCDRDFSVPFTLSTRTEEGTALGEALVVNYGPSVWRTTSMGDHQYGWPPVWGTTCMGDRLYGGPPVWGTTCMGGHLKNTVLDAHLYIYSV